MLTIGLTGSIGSGKSTVADYFECLGINIIDADKISREIIQSKPAISQEIVHHFGKNILNPEENLDRKKLREIIFTDPNERDWLEKLLHPLITKEIEQRIKTTSSPYCILVVPLLLEKGNHLKVNRVLIVETPEEQQKERVKQRDKLTEQQVDAILKTQANRHERLKKADDIIHNEGSLDKLKQQVELLHKKYLELSEL